jgi:hypothetical protein
MAVSCVFYNKAVLGFKKVLFTFVHLYISGLKMWCYVIVTIRTTGQGCQIFLGTIYQHVENDTKLLKKYTMKMSIKYIKWP